MNKNVVICFLGAMSTFSAIGCGTAGPSLAPGVGSPPPVTQAIVTAKALNEIPAQSVPVAPATSTNSSVVNTTNPIDGDWERSMTKCTNNADRSASLNFSFYIYGNTGSAVLKYTSGIEVSLPIQLSYLPNNKATVSPGIGAMRCVDTSSAANGCANYMAPQMPTNLTYNITGGVLTLAIDADAMCKSGTSSDLSSTATFSVVQ